MADVKNKRAECEFTVNVRRPSEQMVEGRKDEREREEHAAEMKACIRNRA